MNLHKQYFFLVGMAFCLLGATYPYSAKAQQVDIGIFISSEPNTIEVRIRPDFFLPSGGIGIDEVSYTVRWPATSTINIDNNEIIPFFIQPQGEPQLDGEHYYQVFTNPTIINPYGDDIAANEEVVAASFEYSGDEVEYFEIINNEWTGDNHGDFYIGLRGEDGTGEIYQPVASFTERILDVTVFLEGPYRSDSGNMTTSLNNQDILPFEQPYHNTPWLYSGNEAVESFHPDVVDWVLVEFIDAENAADASTTNSFLEKALLVGKDGNLVNQQMQSPRLMTDHTLENDLFIIIRHRNHIDILSQQALEYNANNNTYSYDFSTGMNQAYNGSSGYKRIDTMNNLYGMVAGDADGDGEILPSDRSIFRENFGISEDYNPADYDFDGEVLPTDRSIFRTNFGVSNPL